MKPSNDKAGSKIVRRIRIRAIAFLVLAVVAGSASIFLIKVYLDRAQRGSGSASVKTIPVVVAAQDLEIATEIEARHLTIVRWPAESVPTGAFSTTEDLLGRPVRQNLVKGEPVLAARMVDSGGGQGLSSLLKDGMRAMSVRVNDVIGVAGFVQPGDYVDVISTVKLDEEFKKNLKSEAAKVSKMILQNVKVISVGEHLSGTGPKPVKVKVVTLEVTPAQSERLALGSMHGEVILAMRSTVDSELVATTGVTPIMLISPDEGAQPFTFATAPAATEEQKTERARRAGNRRSSSRKGRRAASPPAATPATPAKPAAAVVEILRGSRKVEAREIRPSADSSNP